LALFAPRQAGGSPPTDRGFAITGSPVLFYSSLLENFFSTTPGRRSALRCCGGFQPVAAAFLVSAPRAYSSRRFPSSIIRPDYIPVFI
jgi:hypothetical protein